MTTPTPALPPELLAAIRDVSAKVRATEAELHFLTEDAREGVSLAVRAAELEVRLESTRQQEHVGRCEVESLEALARKELSMSGRLLAIWHTKIHSLAQGTALLRRAEELHTLPPPAVPAAGAALCAQLCAFQKPPHNLVAVLFDVLLGVLEPLNQAPLTIPVTQALVRGAAQHPRNAHMWFLLGEQVHEGCTVRLLDGSLWTRDRLLKRSVALAPEKWQALAFIGFNMKDGSTTTLEDGTVLSKKELFLQGLNFARGFGPIYGRVAQCMGPDETVTLAWGETLNRLEMFIRSIALHPDVPHAWSDLGCCLADDETATLEDGKVMDKAQLYKRSIVIHRTGKFQLKEWAMVADGAARSYNNLANCLPDGGSTVLEDGVVVTQEQLYKHAIALDPDFSNAYNNLGTCLMYGGSVTLEDGTVLSKQEIFERAILLDPSNDCAVDNLNDCRRWARCCGSGRTQMYIAQASQSSASCGSMQ